MQAALIGALWSISAFAVGTNELASAGVWTALKSGDSFADVGAVGAGRLALVRPDGSSHFVLRLTHPAWHIQAGTPVSLHIIFTGGDAFRYPALGSGGVIQADIPDDQVASWTHNFTAMKMVTISFEGLSESPWAMPLTGTTPTVTAMAKAMEAGGVTGMPWPWSQPAKAHTEIPDAPAMPNTPVDPQPTPAGPKFSPPISPPVAPSDQEAQATKPPLQQTPDASPGPDTVAAPAEYATIVPVEPGAIIYDTIKGNSELLNEMVKLVRLNDYKCSSISGAMPFIFSSGFKLVCNKYRYTYGIEDKGGHWVVTVE
jgi:hypothetical protein